MKSSFLSIQIVSPMFGLLSEHLLEGLKNQNVQFYKNFMVDLAISYGAKQEDAEKEISEAIEFEIELAKVSFISIIYRFFKAKECTNLN